ncbi:hypothetical protein H4219_006370 [Mycoemilia scoparia]|uniref:Uncharacterized protein n=1 Tax=Mycoemilia scoparia TaxID=417184 RepID=A0A9W7ZI37_9FUNG|nr:hypothetical protein H4219_006370 [Mycoemilia scoparia]
MPARVKAVLDAKAMPETDNMNDDSQTQLTLLVLRSLNELVVKGKDGKETAQVGTWLEAAKLKFKSLGINNSHRVHYALMKILDGLLVEYERWRVTNKKSEDDWDAFEEFLH